MVRIVSLKAMNTKHALAGLLGVICSLQQISSAKKLIKIPTEFDYEYEMDCPNPVNEYILFSWTTQMGIPYRAIRTAPYPQISIRTSTIPNAGLGTFTDVFMKGNTWLAEYEGLVVPRKQVTGNTDDTYMWRVFQDGYIKFFCDAIDMTSSNWLRFVNGARWPREQNVMVHQCYDKVYYRVMKDLPPGTELFVYYGEEYTANLGVDTSVFENNVR